MVRTLALFIAALAASCVYAAPLEARRHKHHKSAQAAAATAGVAAAGVAAGAAAVTAAPTPTVAAAGASNVDASISAAVAAASASAAAAQQALIDANTTPGEAFASPEFQGEEAGLQLKIQLETEAGEDAAAAADQEALDELNQGAGGGI